MRKPELDEIQSLGYSVNGWEVCSSDYFACILIHRTWYYEDGEYYPQELFDETYEVERLYITDDAFDHNANEEDILDAWLDIIENIDSNDGKQRYRLFVDEGPYVAKYQCLAYNKYNEKIEIIYSFDNGLEECYVFHAFKPCRLETEQALKAIFDRR